MRSRKAYILYLFCIGVVLISVATFCNQPAKNTPAEQVYLNHSDTVAYVGMQTCRQCHSAIYESFMNTGMGQSFEKASKKKSAAKFGKHDLVYDPDNDLYYHPFWSDTSFYIMEFRLSGKDTIHKRVEKVDYIIGSGQHTNSHIMSRNGYLFQMPITFYTQKGKWDLPPGFEKGNNARFDRAIELECMSCHNAYPKFVEGSKNKFASVLQGIDCERCHGPGEIHVREKSLGNLIDTSKYIDYTIVNPKKLPYELQVDVCQRCHLQGNAVLKEEKSFFDFKPGMKLSDYMNIFLPRYEGKQDKFIMASHSDRLQQSKCFIESKKRKIQVNKKQYLNAILPNDELSSLTCISCHDPHVSVKVTAAEQFNRSCKGCHSNKQLTNLTDCTEKISIRKAKNDNCSGCHMPRSGSIDIPHVSITDHRIQVPISKKNKDAIHKFISLAAINNPASDSETLAEAYISYYEKFEGKTIYLDSAWACLFRSTIKESKRHQTNLVNFYFLKNDFKSVINVTKEQPTSMKNSWMAYRIGESYNQLGETAKAYSFFKQSVELAPYILEFRNKLANAASILGNYAEAKQHFEFIVREDPEYIAALSNLGYLYLTENRIEEAGRLYDRAIALDADYEPALMNKAGWYLYKDDKVSAKRILSAIIRKNPKNTRAKAILATL